MTYHCCDRCVVVDAISATAIVLYSWTKGGREQLSDEKNTQYGNVTLRSSPIVVQPDFLLLYSPWLSVCQGSLTVKRSHSRPVTLRLIHIHDTIHQSLPFSFMTTSILSVAFGGACGSVLRFLISQWLQPDSIRSIPLGTLTVNLLGCLIVGFLHVAFENSGQLNPHARQLLVIGFCGGFTTFSTFCNESFQLLRQDLMFTSLLYVVGSVVTGIIGVYLGMMTARWVFTGH